MNDVNYEYKHGMVEFSNHVIISETELDALFKLKMQVTCSPSFIWMALRQLEEKDDSLTVRFLKINYKRKQKTLEILRDAGHYRMEVKEMVVDLKNKVEVRLSQITPEFKSILPFL